MSSRDTIFLINDAGELEQVPHRLFSSEDLFQTLIEIRVPKWLWVCQVCG